MDPVHDRGYMDPDHESGPWTRSKVGVHGPLVHVLSSPKFWLSSDNAGKKGVKKGVKTGKWESGRFSQSVIIIL